MTTDDDAVTHLPAIAHEILAPFDYFQGVASNIRGLGGTEPRPELGYGFHTHYVRAAPGHCTYVVQFEELQATHGLLYLQVHMTRNIAGAEVKIASMERVSLAELAASGGRATVRFESLRGIIYALFGRVGETDASATSLTVTLDRPGSDADDAESDMLPTTLGRDAARTTERLTSLDRAQLSEPVSQVCTPAQYDEGAFRRWCAAMHEPAAKAPRLWEQAYILQVLKAYGMIDASALGLGFGAIESAVPDVLSAAGCHLVLADSPEECSEEEWQARRWQRLLLQAPRSELRLRTQVAIRPADVTLPGTELGQFDFLWSAGHVGRLADPREATQFLHESLERLRQGGIAVHCFKVSLDNFAPATGEDEELVLNRSDVERLCLMLISRGHTVAQLKFEMGSKPRASFAARLAPVPFGLIIGRGSR